MTAKSPQEMAEDIIKSLKITDSASVLLDLYLERAIQEHKREDEPNPTDYRLMKVAEMIQEDCHNTIKKLKESGSKSSHQDLINVYIFNSLVILQIKIQDLEKEVVALKKKKPLKS